MLYTFFANYLCLPLNWNYTHKETCIRVLRVISFKNLKALFIKNINGVVLLIRIVNNYKIIKIYLYNIIRAT